MVFFTFTKEITKIWSVILVMSLNKQIVADQYHMYSTEWVNQFEIKETFIKFMINDVSPQGNVKIKFNLKVEEICRDYSPNFLWNK